MNSQPDNLSNTLAQAMLLVLLLQPAARDSFAGQAANQQNARHFSEFVLPLLKRHCYQCHSHQADAVEGGLVLDSRSGWQVGGDSGPAIVVGRPDESLLVAAINYSGEELRMPPGGKLPQHDIEVLRKWIADGAYDPREGLPDVPHDNPPVPAGRLWSLQPIEPVEAPGVADDPWCGNDIDRFILDKLRQHGLQPNHATDKYALLRRATFDLTGLPPTLDQIAQFVTDDRADAYERLIDRLLASPHYGERWGRHWLDLARYGDSNGGDINYAHANAWRYRDYVIRAFNNDKPYDEFIREQLAGDLLSAVGNTDRRRELLTATGFLMLGPKMLAEVDTDKLLIDIVDEQLDVTGRTFLGMTFGCARCHDHKFDPITTKDYYAMAGIFRSTKVIDVLRPKNGVSEWLEIDATPDETRATINRLKDEQKQLQQQLAALGAVAPGNRSVSNAADKAILATNLPPLSSTTWAAWVRIATPQRLGAVLSANYQGAGQGHSLGFDRGQTPRIVWNHGSGQHTIIAAARPISLGVWHHLALTFDADSQQLRLFVNGSLAAMASDVSTSEFSTISAGRREASGEWQLIGDVDELQVYDSALSEQQIRELAGRRTLGVAPLLHWSFEQVRDDTVVDSAGRFDGLLIGVSAKNGIVRDGAAGQAFSFNVLQKPAPPDETRKHKIAELRKQLQVLDTAMPSTTLVMAVAETTPVSLPVHIRGSHRNLAKTAVPRSTPEVFSQVLTPVSVPSSQSGRLQLANWIADPRNPLTARVMVNRLWQHHFKHGLVRTPSNFGTRGELPSHPRLLTWLAGKFMADGWSMKQMHRLIMTSATYRMSSRFNAAAEEHDPDNRLLARYPVRRLEAEAIRDSLLAVSGGLDRTVGGTLFKAPNKKRVTMTPGDPAYDNARRSVYLPAVRVRGYEMFSIFDVSDNGQHVAQRPATMVAQQALFLMNNPLVLQRSETLAEQIGRQTGSFEERVGWLHRMLYGRPATGRETETLAAVFTQLAGDRSQPDAAGDISAWQHIIHTMICANEFIHLR